MTMLLAPPLRRSWPLRLLNCVRDTAIGTLLCLSPLGAVFALGWMTRQMRARAEAQWGGSHAHSGWVLGDSGASGWRRLCGGLADNLKVGLTTACALALLTMPFTLLWLGAWWAGWENSFNKGYEQAWVGPVVFLCGTLLALPLLAHLPLAMAHGAAEGRFASFFEFRRVRSVAVAAGWRLPWLAVLALAFSVPVFLLRAVPVFVESIVPGFALLSDEEQSGVGSVVSTFAAAIAFVGAYWFKLRAVRIYADAAPIAAQGRAAAHWAGTRAARQTPSRRVAGQVGGALWLMIACAVWLGVALLILVGQFLNYQPALWLTHPVFFLPWAG